MLVNIFSRVLFISIMASALIILILLVKALFKEKLSARWHYYIWLLLIVRLIIPYTPSFSIDFTGIIPQSRENVSVQTEKPDAIGVDANQGANLTINDGKNISGYSAEGSVVIAGEEEKSGSSGNMKEINGRLKQMVMETGSKIWVIGAFLFILYILVINLILNYRIKKSTIPIEDNDIQKVLEYCRKLVHIKSNIPVIYQKHIRTPAIYGVFKTKMLMPVDILDRLDREEVRYVVLHELHHFKRKDMIIGMLQTLLCALYWFNPLIWYAFGKMREDREPVCDEMVLSCLKPDERKSYAETLIKILGCFSEKRWIYSTAGISQGSAANMEWRIKLMKTFKKRSVARGIITALVTFTLGATGVLAINNQLGFAFPANTNNANTAAAAKEEIPTRGKILDRNGRELAVSIPADTIAVSPRQIKASGMDTDVVAEALADILSMDKEKVLEKVSAPSAYEIVKRQVDKEAGNKIKEWVERNQIKGIIIDKDSKRVYLNSHQAAHVIGFIGTDGLGLDGIELSMDRYLKLKGTNVSVEGKKTLQGGADVVLTIDMGIQKITENSLDKAIADYRAVNGAAAIIMDSKTGEILAMVSRPDFDPNMPFSSPSGADPGTWKGSTEENAKLLADTVWKNKGISSSFEPGSVFKIITAAAGLEEGAITLQSPVDDTPVSIGIYKINCWNPNTHGQETFEQAVYNSCNPVFVRVAQGLGTDKFYKYMRSFGFYDRSGLELPGEVQSVIHAKPSEIDMAVASFGQRFQVTPIQLASAYNAVANGGKLMKPQIIRQIVDSENGSIKAFEPEEIGDVISKKTADSLKKMLEGAVLKGTAANAYMEGYKIAGSSGTSEKANGKHITSFAGFAPADNPEIVCILILDEPMTNEQTGGMTAAPAAGKLMKEILDYKAKK